MRRKLIDSGKLGNSLTVIGEHLFECCSAFSALPKPERARDYFIPGFKLTAEAFTGRSILMLGGTVIDVSRTQDIVYRKLRCSHPGCRRWKWANEFDWNRKGFEGPFKQFWGKRDCWCKVCRSKMKARKRGERTRMLKRRKGTDTADLTRFTIIERFKPCDPKEKQRAYRELLDRVFFRMAQE